MRSITSKKNISIILIIALLLSMTPFELLFATVESTNSSQEASEQSEASSLEKTEQAESTEVQTVLKGSSLDGNAAITEHGTISLSQSANIINGVATPDNGYALATVRCIMSDGTEEYITYTEQSNGTYTFSIVVPNKGYEITACFYNKTVWDGAVDLTWYDPSKTSFDIYTPAQFAGLAAIVNGMVDNNETSEEQIIDKESNRTKNSDGSYSHKYLKTKKYYASITEKTGGGVEDIVYRMPQAENDIDSTGTYVVKKNKSCIYNDMRYCTINIMADLDMASLGKNYMPIGGKYAMDNTKTGYSDDAKVIDTRFQGVLNGHGHTINISCNRYTAKGFAYSMDIGLVGYLGGGVDFANNEPKDCPASYEDNWEPSVRNLIVTGEVYGRRMVGGIVGRTGEVSTSTVVENCANKSYVHSTDMRGVAGIVGAPWGACIIRNCYNAGTISAVFGECGGIVGCNGYRYKGADIYNCYNVAEVSSDYEPNTEREIGYDGDGSATNIISNCYYLSETKDTSINSGYYIGTNAFVTLKNVKARRSAEMKTQDFVDTLNCDGNSFKMDGNSINSGYPVLYFEGGLVENTHTVSVTPTSNGSVSCNASTVSTGTVVSLTATANPGYKLDYYEINGNRVYDSFYTVTTDTTIKGVFVETQSVQLILKENDAYNYNIVKIYDGKTHETVNVSLSAGATLNEGDIIKCLGSIKEGACPGEENLEYSGKFGNPKSENPKATRTDNQFNLNELTVTGVADVSIVLQPSTRGKQWTSVADTSWYDNRRSGQKTFVLTTPNQLAGMAKLLNDGIETFEGMTIKLGNDICLENNDGTKGGRNWTQAGTANVDGKHCFKGTFDGCGYEISELKRNFQTVTSPGSNGGLFGVVSGATIKNVTVSGYFEKGANTSAAIVGTAMGNTTISNCTCNVVINGGTANCAGVVGQISKGSVTISNCTNNAELAGQICLGGIVGKIGINSNVTINSCTNNGRIKCSSYIGGGIVGQAQNDTSAPSTLLIKKSVNNGEIIATQSTSSSVSEGVGGIVGSSELALTVEKCVNNGDISNTGRTASTAGIVGYAYNLRYSSGNYISEITIKDSYNVGNIYSNSNASDASVVGIANISTNNKVVASISNCYNAGTISIGSDFVSGNCYACFGKNSNSSLMTNNYYLNTSCNKAGRNETSKTSTQLKNLTSTLGSAYVNDSSNINNGYPILSGLEAKHVLVRHSLEKATTDNDGTYEYWQCSNCGAIYLDSQGKHAASRRDIIIKSVVSVEMSKSVYKYTGNDIEPIVTIVDSGRSELVCGTDYDVTYSNNNAPGKATATVNFKGYYSGEVNLYFYIISDGINIVIKGYDGDENVTVTLSGEGVKKTTSGKEICSFDGLSKGDYSVEVKGPSDSDYITNTVNIKYDGSILKEILLCKLGDTNCDGIRSAEDVTRLARHLSRLNVESDSYKLKLFDTNRNSTIDASDATHLARFVAKIIDRL